MGCGGSKDPSGKSPGGYSNSYDRRPKISVRIQPQVKKLENGPRIVFIFGGPGSRKGRIVDDLRSSYGFKFICGEELVFQELPKKLANSVKLESVMDIKDLLEDDPSHISLDWLLQLVAQRIEQDEEEGVTYLVDIMPNLKYMLKSSSFGKDCKHSMAQFEERYPVSFALSLAIPADKVLKAKQAYSIQAKPAAGEKMKEGGQSDEADSGRTQKRAAMYEQSVRVFLNYFAETERLVTVDVTCGVADLIWHQVHKLLCELDFHPSRTVNTVILFTFNEGEAADIDYDKYLMDKVQLKDLVVNPNDSIENLLQALSRHVDNQSKNCDSFVVNLEGTSITRDKVQNLQKKLIVFLEMNEGFIETYLPGSPKNFIPKKDSTRYKAVCSLENEICLFPKETGPEVCSKIAAILVNSRTL